MAQDAIRLNADFRSRAVMREADAVWTPSPAPGVTRRMLDRIGGEVARATSIVRYAPNSRFPVHRHDGGEEFYVLDGVFSDAAGDYPAGTYVRNPPGTSHAPWTDGGCLLFVKLRQMREDDSALLRLDTTRHGWRAGAGGASEMMLYEGPDERVALWRWPAGYRASVEAGADGLELLLLEGAFSAGGAGYGKHDWLRLPPGDVLDVAAARPCTLLAKHGRQPAD
jgi:hypothetical protein